MVRSNTVKILSGQLVWAASQAAIVIVLARQGSIELVGLYTLALAIYTPICLALGLNMRILVANDSEHKLSVVPLLSLRIFTSLVALTPAAVILFSKGHTQLAIIALTLLVGRVGDQVADLGAGYHQRHTHPAAIGQSFAVRGLLTGLPFLLLAVADNSLLTTAIASSSLSFLATLMTDIRLLSGYSSGRTTQPVRNVFNSIRPALNSAPYPFLDSLYLNSIRYSFALFLGTNTLGYLSIAQTLYSPVQLLISAIGYTYLTDSRQLTKLRSHSSIKLLKRHFMKGMLSSLLISTSFILLCLSLPEPLLEFIFRVDPHKLKQTLILLSACVFLLPYIGFATLTAFSQDQYLKPTMATVSSIGLFTIILSIMYLSLPSVTMLEITIAFVASALLRLTLTVWNLFDVHRNGL